MTDDYTQTGNPAVALAIGLYTEYNGGTDSNSWYEQGAEARLDWVNCAVEWLAAHDAELRETVARALWARLPEILREQTHDDCGWLSDAQDAQLDATEDAITFCGQGSIDVHHIADYAASVARGKE